MSGDVVLVRDDNYGQSGFNDLANGNGTLVVNNVVLPVGTLLGAQRLLGSGCDIAVQPYRKDKVYAAFTQVINGAPNLVIEFSNDSGVRFTGVYSIDHASLPSLAVASDGVLGPDGIMTNPALSSVTFIATPTNNYFVDKWYLDGIAVLSNTPSLTVSNIASEHTLLVTFSPSNDLAVTLFESSADEGPTETGDTNIYIVEVENKGLNPLTGASLMDSLDPTVQFVSATTSQGTVVYVGGQVIANVGTLNPGELATVNIHFDSPVS